MKAFVIFRDRVTYAQQCVAALMIAGLEPVIVDQGSSWPEAVAWLAWLVSRWTDRPMPTVPLPPRLVLWSSVALVVAWSVLRNLPVGAYFGSGLA